MTEASKPPRRASLGVIFGIVLLDLLGFGILIPQLGVYGMRFADSPFLVSLLGLMLSVYSLMQLIFAPVLGRLSDRFGRRPVLLYSMAGSLAGYLLFAFAQSLPLLFLSRVVDGISGANISTAQAYVADVTTPDNRAKGMGMVGAAFGLGFLLGPAIGGFLGRIGGNFAIGIGSAALTALNLIFAIFFLPESRHPGSQPAQERSMRAVLTALKTPLVGLVLLLFGLFVTAFAQMEGTLSPFVLSQHLLPDLETARHDEKLMGEASLQVGYLFAAVGVVSTVVQGGLIGRLKRRFGEPTLVVAGVAFTALGLGLIPVAPSYSWFFGPVVLLALGSALVNPSLSAILSTSTSGDRQGEVLGAYQSMGSLGRIIGPALGTWLLARSPPAPYVLAAVMLALAVVPALRLRTLVARSGQRAAS
jgi:DHA1 family tetracycline resistance protein-like MFS transporter